MLNNLRVLVYSNPLVVDKISKKFLFWKDSGFIFTRNLLRTFPENYRVTWLVPDKIKETEEAWFKDVPPRVELLPYPYSTSIHQNRYEFCGNVLRANFPYTTDIDVIINNQPEIAANLRVWANNQRRDNPLIYSFFHWLDCDESREFSEALGGYFWRQYDGYLASDAVYIHREYGIDLFLREIETKNLPCKLDKIRPYTPPPTTYGEEPFELPEGKKIILFNHRLNNTTRWKEVLDACSTLWEKGTRDFVLWLTDENGSGFLRNADSLRKYPFVIIKSVPDKSYGYLLRNAHFAICNHRGYSTWNMAVIDAINVGCFSMLPLDRVYEQMFGDTGYYHIDNPQALLGAIENWLKTSKETLTTLAYAMKSYLTAIQLIPLDLVTKQISYDIIDKLGKIPRRYKDVEGFIRVYEPVEKAEWVNKFWSFHTNSNFQKIRWHLLHNGIADDTRKERSTYYIDEGIHVSDKIF